jgi:hypothetical protein
MAAPRNKKKPQDRKARQPTKAERRKALSRKLLKEIETHNQVAKAHEQIGKEIEQRKGRIGVLEEQLNEEFGGMDPAILREQQKQAAPTEE